MGGTGGLEGGGGVWPRSRPRCAVSGAEHALSAGERSGLSGGSPGSCAPAVSSIVTPSPPSSSSSASSSSAAPHPSRAQQPAFKPPSLPPLTQQQRSGSHATSQQPAAREGTAGAPERVKAKERETKEEKKIRRNGLACLLRQCGEAGAHRGTGEPTRRPARPGVHTRGRLHTRALAHRGPGRCGSDGHTQKSPAPCRSRGKRPGNFLPHSPVPAWGTSRLVILCVPLAPAAPPLTLPPTGTDAGTRQEPTLCLVTRCRMCP